MIDPVVTAVEVEAVGFWTKVKAFADKYGPYSGVAIVAALLGHFL